MKRLALFAATGLIAMLPSIASARPHFFWGFRFGLPVPVIAPAIVAPVPVVAPPVVVPAPAVPAPIVVGPCAVAPVHYYHYGWGYHPGYYYHPWGWGRYHYWR